MGRHWHNNSSIGETWEDCLELGGMKEQGMRSLVNCSIVQVKCKSLEENNLGEACTRLEEFDACKGKLALFAL